MRIMPRDVNNQFERVLKAARVIGYDTEQWQLQIGSSTNGVAYRLQERVLPGHGVRGLITPDGYLGMTRAEAHATLSAIAQTLETIKWDYDTGRLSITPILNRRAALAQAGGY